MEQQQRRELRCSGCSRLIRPKSSRYSNSIFSRTQWSFCSAFFTPKKLYLSVFKSPKGRWFVGNYSYTFWRWSRWKNQKLLDLARNLIRATREVNPSIKFVLNFMYESVTDQENALAWLSQDLEAAMKLPLDFYAIMAYHRQIKKELHLSDEGNL